MRMHLAFGYSSLRTPLLRGISCRLSGLVARPRVEDKGMNREQEALQGMDNLNLLRRTGS